MHLVKGHGTQNDFLVLPDLAGDVDLSPAAVRALCDRRAGLGADGILRVVRSENAPESKEFAADAPFFMDYRNADGSVAEMCGNGVRVFVRYLQRESLVEDVAAVATRGGIRRARARGGGDVTVYMGLPRVLADRPIATAALTSGATSGTDQIRGTDQVRGTDQSHGTDQVRGTGRAVEVPNPHVVVNVPDLDMLADLDLTRPPVVEPTLAHGQNVEFVVRLGEQHLQLRVHERGVGETRSCGTGICAAAVAAALDDGVGPHGQGSDARPWRVDVPGGTCEVIWQPDGELLLTGPAVLVADLEVDDAWLRAAAR